MLITDGMQQLIIEVKLGATQTVTQVEAVGMISQLRKYARYKIPLAYLSLRDSTPPNCDSRFFIGQRTFEDLFIALSRNNARLSETARHFMDFMKENGMSQIEPLTSNDVRLGGRAHEIIRKQKALLDELRPLITNGAESIFKRVCAFGRTQIYWHGETIYIEARPKRYSVNSIVVWIGPASYGLEIYLPTSLAQKTARRLGWNREGTRLYPGEHPLKPGITATKLMPALIADFRALKRVLR